MTLKWVPTKSRVSQSQFLFLNRFIFTTTTSSTPSASLPFAPSYHSQSAAVPHSEIISDSSTNLTKDDVFSTFKLWFECRNRALLNRIFQILSSSSSSFDSIDGPSLPFSSADAALSQLNLRLTESFVLEVLNFGDDVLSCLKFFDWAGRQHGFHHTRATYHAIFKILSRAKLMPLMIDFMNDYKKEGHLHKVRFHNTLVMGYALAGKPDIALQLFGKMRFQGLDLDGFTYHVLLNALVEESCFDIAEVVLKQIATRGLENDITHSIVVKSFCKQKQLGEAEELIRQMLREGKKVNEHMVGMLVDFLCRENKFEKAGLLIEEFQELDMLSMEFSYAVWIDHLVRAGNVNGALDFLKTKKLEEGYVPDVFRFNILISKLLRQNRLEDVWDLLTEMKEGNIVPDKMTMNAVLCLFCKAGLVDIALGLYDASLELGLSLNAMAYNYLINSLCGDDRFHVAYCVFKGSIKRGYFPGKRTFAILADALCREGKLDNLRELVFLGMERNLFVSFSTYNKLITALCRARRVEDGYLMHEELRRIGKETSQKSFLSLIQGFNHLDRGDISARLLIEMQIKGHTPRRTLFRAVIRSICNKENPEPQFLKLLEMQLSFQKPIVPACQAYNFFIDGAGYAKKPELARNVYDLMKRNGVSPNLISEILMLRSYLSSEKISDALSFFNDLRSSRTIGRRLYSTLIVGLCKANRVNTAWEIMKEVRQNGFVPSLECYEELVRFLCSNRNYDAALYVIDDLERVGRQVSPFIGNVLLLHSLKSKELYKAWISSKVGKIEEHSSSLMLGQLIGIFSGHIEMDNDIEYLEELIGQCFPLDIYTYNMLLKRLSMIDMDQSCALFNRIRHKGFEPNRWTYDILVHGLYKHRRTVEARRWMEEMFRKGFFSKRSLSDDS
ncbi:Pentatricopeptide repeat [Dillenia turbinata]|uniref:Pentatricopeptide repeat n=1 Tax=Dillenia turbinata TaxID=194707 RepID=A0AAN8VVC0_9MAGN